MRDRPGAVMLFAAGLGTRMRPLTADRPKALVEVAGRTLLDHALAQVPAGMGRVANTHYRADVIAPVLAERMIAGSHEPDLLDTGGGLKAARALLGPGPVVTLNTDAVWTGPSPIETLLAAWDPRRMGALLVTVEAPRAQGHGTGDFDIAGDGRLTRGRDGVYTGAQIIDPAVLDRIDAEAFSLNLAWDILAAEGRLFGVRHPGGWCDVGRPENIELAEAMLRAPGDA